jgi:hypothetical protein
MVADAGTLEVRGFCGHCGRRVFASQARDRNTESGVYYHADPADCGEAAPSALKKRPSGSLRIQHSMADLQVQQPLQVAASDADVEAMEECIDMLNGVFNLDPPEVAELMERTICQLEKPGCIDECIELGGVNVLVAVLKEFDKDARVQELAVHAVTTCCHSARGTAEVYQNEAASFLVFMLATPQLWVRAVGAITAALRTNPAKAVPPLQAAGLLDALGKRLGCTTLCGGSVDSTTVVPEILEIVAATCKHHDHVETTRAVLRRCQTMRRNNPESLDPELFGLISDIVRAVVNTYGSEGAILCEESQLGDLVEADPEFTSSVQGIVRCGSGQMSLAV